MITQLRRFYKEGVDLNEKRRKRDINIQQEKDLPSWDKLGGLEPTLSDRGLFALYSAVRVVFSKFIPPRSADSAPYTFENSTTN